MSRFDVVFEDNNLTKLTVVGFDEIAEEALKEASPILRDATIEACQAVIQHPDDSELVKSWKETPPKETKSKDAYIANIVPKGNSSNQYYYAQDGRGGHTKRKYPVSNALKAIWLNYGVNGRDPKPFLENAAKNCEDAVEAKIQEVFNRKVGAE